MKTIEFIIFNSFNHHKKDASFHDGNKYFDNKSMIMFSIKALCIRKYRPGFRIIIMFDHLLTLIALVGL